MDVNIQRVRIGLTGLAFVFVVVLLAAVLTSPSEEQPITPTTVQQQMSSGPAASGSAPVEDALPKEPLAELGVAPGNVGANNVAATDSGEPPRQ